MDKKNYIYLGTTFMFASLISYFIEKFLAYYQWGIILNSDKINQFNTSPLFNGIFSNIFIIVFFIISIYFYIKAIKINR